MRFEEHYSSHIEISKKALKKNLAYLRTQIGPNARFGSVIKGNAYGHGIANFLPLAERFGVDYFCVADAYEAYIASEVKQKKNTHIMIMSHIDEDAIDWAIENDVSFYVFEFERLNDTIRKAKRIGKKAKIHIEFETGLNRTGFEFIDLGKLIETLQSCLSYLEIMGFCTHYAGAESVANYLRVMNQIDRYYELRRLMNDHGITAQYNHTACSAAALTYPDTIMDLARIGIAQYGFWPSAETRMHNLLDEDKKYTKDPLTRMLAWKSKVMSLKTVNAGEFISYGNSHLATKNEKIATVPVGYAHGFNRSLSNMGQVLINRKKCQVVGMVNMNMILVDVTHLPRVQKGDEVVLIGKQGRHEISVASFAEMSNYVNYELLARLPSRIPRKIVNNNV